MKIITDHVVNSMSDRLIISVTDQLGAGGANHRYQISGFDCSTNTSYVVGKDDPHATLILFQNGPISEVGVNGVTQEALLAIVADRLKSFQAGPFASDYNAEALEHVTAAQEALWSRTRDRMARCVEGVNIA